MAERPSVEEFERELSAFGDYRHWSGYWRRDGNVSNRVEHRNAAEESRLRLVAMFRAALEAK